MMRKYQDTNKIEIIQIKIIEYEKETEDSRISSPIAQTIMEIINN